MTKRRMTWRAGLIGGLAAAFALSGTAAAQPPRDPWLKPFSQSSIWNTPIGAGAVYQSKGHFPVAEYVHSDDEYHYKTSANDPLRPLYSPGSWTDRCNGTTPGQVETQMRIADDIVLGDAITTGGIYETPNNVAVFLKPDGDSLLQLEPLCRDTAGGPVYGYQYPVNESIRGTGIHGTHWGSGLSGIGGSLRHGELTGPEPIQHALKLNVWGKYLYYNTSDPTPGYRWPADRSDSYAPQGYQGTNPKIEMGALMALHPSETPEGLGIKTEAGRKIFAAMQNYGAYLADDTGWNAAALSLSIEARQEFEEVYGYSFNQGSYATGEAKDWFDDFNKILMALQVVDNSSPTSIGGGGARRAPLVTSSFASMDATAPTAPSGLALVSKDVNQVTLRWNASTDNVRVMEYEVYQGTTKVGSTYGRTSITLTGLSGNTAYAFKIRAKDTNLNRSGFSSTLNVTTNAGYAANFGTGATGWTLTNASAANGTLTIGNWEQSASAIYEGQTFTAPYVYEIKGSAAGGDYGNMVRILFNYTDGSNYNYVEYNGGQWNTITLKKVVGGTTTTLATYPGSLDIRNALIRIQAAAGGQFTVTAIQNGTATTLFQVTDSSNTSGKIGASTSYNVFKVSSVVVKNSLGDTTAPTAPASLAAGQPTSTAVGLTWTGSTDNTGVTGYQVFRNGAAAGITGGTSFTVEKLLPGKTYTFTVRAIDQAGNLSGASNTVTVTTTPYVHSGVDYAQDFNGGTPAGWSLASASVANSRLQLTNWGGTASGIYDNLIASGNYVYTVKLQTDANDNNAKTRVFFNYTDANNTYYVEFGGGTTNTVSLVKVAGGTVATLATYSGSYTIKNWDWPAIKIQYDYGKISVTGVRSGTTTSLFSQVQDTTHRSGKIGVGTLYAQSFAEDVIIQY